MRPSRELFLHLKCTPVPFHLLGVVCSVHMYHPRLDGVSVVSARAVPLERVVFAAQSRSVHVYHSVKGGLTCTHLSFSCSRESMMSFRLRPHLSFGWGGWKWILAAKFQVNFKKISANIKPEKPEMAAIYGLNFGWFNNAYPQIIWIFTLPE